MGSMRSARQDPGHNAALPLDAQAHTHRRHLPGCAWTGASSRGQGSGSCFQPGTGLGLQQVSHCSQGAGAGWGRPAVQEQPDCLAPPRAERPGAWT